jgi:RNA-binding protein
MALSSAQKRYLRGLTHHINPVVIVGDKGLTENVLAEIRQALDHHELIKVRLRADRATRAVLTAAIQQHCDADLVHKIGQVACFFRRNTEKPVIELPRD